MKQIIGCLLILGFAGCVGPRNDIGKQSPGAKSSGEPVMVIYHVKSGAEEELKSLLVRAREIYLREGMVYSEPYLSLWLNEDDKNTRFVDFFLWAGPFATEHPSKSVEQVVDQMHALCEPRAGKLAIEFRNVEVLKSNGFEFKR